MKKTPQSRFLIRGELGESSKRAQDANYLAVFSFDDGSRRSYEDGMFDAVDKKRFEFSQFWPSTCTSLHADRKKMSENAAWSWLIDR